MPIKQALLLALAVALMASLPPILAIAIPPSGPAVGSSPFVATLLSGPPYTPGGPAVHLTLQNTGDIPVANLSAVLTLQYGYTFYFSNVTVSSPLRTGQIASASMILLQAGFTCGKGYPLAIQGVFTGGSTFDFSLSPTLTCT